MSVSLLPSYSEHQGLQKKAVMNIEQVQNKSSTNLPVFPSNDAINSSLWMTSVMATDYPA